MPHALIDGKARKKAKIGQATSLRWTHYKGMSRF